MDKQHILHPNIVVAALATIAVECCFQPHDEVTTGREYEARLDLGNVNPGDGPRFIGRGLPQLTGRHNYEIYGEWCGYDLVNHPELLERLDVSCDVFARFFKASGCAKYAEHSLWRECRRRYNGGTNGMDRFLAAVSRLTPLSLLPDP
jgi:putative chitinase